MKKPEASHENHERWMVSYADFLTLLFAVFVVLYSFAMAKQSEAQSMVEGLVQSFNEVGLISTTPGIISMPGPIAQTASYQAMQTVSNTDDVNAPVQGGGGVMDFGMPDTTANSEAESNSDSNETTEASAIQGNLTRSELEEATQGQTLKDFNTEDEPNLSKGTFGTSYGDNQDYIAEGGIGPTDAQSDGEGVKGYPFDAIKTSISDTISSKGLENQVMIEDNGKWLTINISSQLLFAEGSASVLNASVPVITEIANALSSINNYVKIRGYTDNVFVDNGVYQNNWELSSARAISVLNLLEKGGVTPNRMSVEGYGQYSPFYSNSTRAGRAQNRRVVIAVSRFAVSSHQLDVLPGDSENIAPTPEAIKAGGGTLQIEHSLDGTIQLNIGE